MSSKRAVCAHCQFVQQQCVCTFIEKYGLGADFFAGLNLPLRVLVLQEKREAKHAKNTVRLLKLAIPEVQIIEVDVEEDLNTSLSSLKAHSTGVLFPSEQATSIETLSTSELGAIETLVLIDATWRRAKRIWFF